MTDRRGWEAFLPGDREQPSPIDGDMPHLRTALTLGLAAWRYEWGQIEERLEAERVPEDTRHWLRTKLHYMLGFQEAKRLTEAGDREAAMRVTDTMAAIRDQAASASEQ